MIAPTLETARLVMRGHVVSDFAASAALWGDPQVTRHIGGRTFTEEEVWQRLLRYIGHWQALDFGYWIVHDKAGDFVGEVGFGEHRRAIEPPLRGLEIGWVLSPRAHGKGYAVEAATAALAWAAPRFVDRGACCIIDPDNAASIKVAERLGFREVRRTTYRGDPTIVFERAL